MAVSGANQRDVVGVHDRVINHIFGSGLTLASLVGYPGVDHHVAQRLCDVIDELDAAVRALRSDALAHAVADRDGAAPDTSHSSTRDVATPDPTADVQADRNVWRRLRRVEDTEVIAYATLDHDFFRASDHRLWAHESDGLLLAARSGAPLARRVGEMFYAIESDAPLYYEDQHGRTGPARSPDLPAAAGPCAPASALVPNENVA